MEIETDALQIVQVLDQEDKPPWSFTNLISNLFVFLSKLQAWKVIYIRREANRCAHWLNNHAKSNRIEVL